MGTRATYNLSAGRYNHQQVCFYIHWDGYPAGAASYFWNMYQIKNERGSYAGRFIRGNELAEFTLDHNEHGDTEYCYDLDEAGSLTASEWQFDERQWKIIYSGFWYDFINEFLNDPSKEKLVLVNFKWVNRLD